jgi:hypothetical protein
VNAVVDGDGKSGTKSGGAGIGGEDGESWLLFEFGDVGGAQSEERVGVIVVEDGRHVG